jgi:RNA polymerase sigma-70 factor (ECF subfamily)
MTDASLAAVKFPAEAELATVWQTHARWLKSVVLARLRDPAAAEEVLQETALALAKQESNSAAAFPSWGPWLYRVAIRQAMLYRRRLARGEKKLRSWAGRLAAAENPTSAEPLAWLLSRERASLLRQAMERLPRRDAEILLLKYCEDWSYHQIAQQLGITAAAVEARLHRARGRLRELLADHAPRSHALESRPWEMRRSDR